MKQLIKLKNKNLNIKLSIITIAFPNLLYQLYEAESKNIEIFYCLLNTLLLYIPMHECTYLFRICVLLCCSYIR